MSARGLLILLSILLGGEAAGHEIRPAYLKLVQTSADRFDVTFKQPQVQGRYLGLEAVTDCRRTGQPVRSVDESALQEAWEVICPDGEPERVDIRGLESTMIDTLVNIVYSDGETVNHLITAREPWFIVKQGAPALPLYLGMGVGHLLLGPDHLLFVIVLMFVVRGTANLVKAVTSFTVAHSIALGLSALNVVTVPQAPVEAIIALSIIILSLQAFRPWTGSPWGITFLFGLLHGLGFAGALAEIGLPENTALWALLYFNIGIELGQLGIIALILLLLFALKYFRIELPRYVQTAPIFLAGSVASYWLLERSAQILFQG